MILHLVAPRTGPSNAGPTHCEKCGAEIFDVNGQVIYDAGSASHTTDEATFAAAVEIEMIPCV